MIKVGGKAGALGSLTKAAAQSILTDLKGTGLLLDALELRLYTAGPTPNTSQLWSEFTEATFGGYAALTALTFEATSWEDGYAQVVSLDPPPVFTATNGTTPNTVTGWALTKTASSVTTVIYAENFDVPKPMTQAGHQIIIPAVLTAKTAP